MPSRCLALYKEQINICRIFQENSHWEPAFWEREIEKHGQSEKHTSNYQKDYRAQFRERQNIFTKENVVIKLDFTLLKKQTS